MDPVTTAAACRRCAACGCSIPINAGGKAGRWSGRNGKEKSGGKHKPGEVVKLIEKSKRIVRCAIKRVRRCLAPSLLKPEVVAVQRADSATTDLSTDSVATTLTVVQDPEEKLEDLYCDKTAKREIKDKLNRVREDLRQLHESLFRKDVYITALLSSILKATDPTSAEQDLREFYSDLGLTLRAVNWSRECLIPVRLCRPVTLIRLQRIVSKLDSMVSDLEAQLNRWCNAHNAAGDYGLEGPELEQLRMDVVRELCVFRQRMLAWREKMKIVVLGCETESRTYRAWKRARTQAALEENLRLAGLI